MFKDVLRATDLGDFALIGLVIFVAVFVLVAVWAVTRPKKKVKRWSRMPLEDDKLLDPREPGEQDQENQSDPDTHQEDR